MKKYRFASVAALAALSLWAALPSHADGGGGAFGAYTPTNGQNFTISFSQANYVDIGFTTANHKVLIQASPNTPYYVNWTLETGTDTTVADSDDGGGNYTTNGTGYWEHLAHNTGNLSGTLRFSSGGTYRIYPVARVSYSAGYFGVVPTDSYFSIGYAP